MDKKVSSQNQDRRVQKELGPSNKHNTLNKQKKYVRRVIDDKEEQIETGEKKAWAEYGIQSGLIDCLIKAGFKKPADCQKLSLDTYKQNPNACYILQAPNGAGKTLAFLLPAIMAIDPKIPATPMSSEKGNKQELKYTPQVIILAHNRELSVQTHRVLKNILGIEGKDDKGYNGIRPLLIKAGNYKKLKDGGHILVTTPGVFRNLNNLKGGIEVGDRKVEVKVTAEHARVIVVDECDDVFQNDDNRNFLESCFDKIHPKTYVMFVSATIDKTITSFIDDNVVKKYKKQKFYYEIAPEDLTVEDITQTAILLDPGIRDVAITKIIQNLQNSTGTIIFANKIQDAKDLYTELRKEDIQTLIVHAKLKNKERDLAIEKLLQRQIQAIVSTNLLSRGFDNDKISLVINMGIPKKESSKKSDEKVIDYDTYLHRIGRTGRFKRKGVSLTIVDDDDYHNIAKIEEHFNSKEGEGKCKITLIEDPANLYTIIDKALEANKNVKDDEKPEDKVKKDEGPSK